MKNSIVYIIMFLVFAMSVTSTVQAVSGEETAKITAAAPDKAAVQPKQPRRMLVFNLCEGYKHSSVPYVAKALEVIGQKTGAFETVNSDDMAVFEAENLAKFDAVCFNNTTRLTFENKQYRRNLMDFVRGGKGIVGIHAATDNFYNWPEAAEMFGGIFVSHPWTANGTWAVKIDEPEHKLTEPFGAEGFKISDEIYLVKQLKLRDNSRILLSLDFSDPATLERDNKYPDVPVSWVRDFGKGRVFYCSLGHNHDVLWNPAVLEHYMLGIQFAMGDLEADTTPSGMKVSMLDGMLDIVKDYEFADDRAPLSNIREFIEGFYDDKVQLAAIEQKLVEFLKSDASTAAKDFVCRRLRVIGTGASVAALAEMLDDAETADMARYALERIDSPEVDKALRDALGSAKGEVKIGIINSLGARGDVKAIGKLSALVRNKDEAVAMAAVSALGNMPDYATAKMLTSVGGSSGRLKIEAYRAGLECGENLLASGSDRKARKVFSRIYEDETAPAFVRASAVYQWILAAPEGGFFVANPHEIIEETLTEDDDPDVVKITAVKALVKAEDRKLLRTLSDIYGELESPVKTAVMHALYDRGDKEFKPVLMMGVNDDNDQVKVAALVSLAAVADGDDVSMLAETAAVSDGQVRKAARQTLYSVHDPEADKQIMANIPAAKKQVKLEYIAALGERGAGQASGLLISEAMKGDEEVRNEALKVLTDLAGAEDFDGLLELAGKAESVSARRQAEKALAAVAGKMPQKSLASERLIKVIESADDTDTEVMLMSVLGQVADENAYSFLSERLAEENDAVRLQAIRSLSQWPNARPITTLKAIAKKSAGSTEGTLALRGVIGQVKYLDVSKSAKVEMYKEAMSMAEGLNEKKMILSELSKVYEPGAAELAFKYIDEPQLKNEAGLAVVEIAEKIYITNTEMKSKLQKVIEAVENKSLDERAGQVIAAIDEIDDYIIEWQIAGPYSRENKSATDLFDIKFAPEKHDGSADWKPLVVDFDSKRPGVVDIHRIYKDTNSVVYVKTNVHCDSEKKGILEIGSDDGIKVWVNGEVVHENNVYRGLTKAQDKVDVELDKGKNELMFKITQGSLAWSFIARFAEPDGSSMEGLSFSAE